jgi:hypothetical protein
MNVFELRYRILKEYYDAYFLDDIPLRFDTLLITMRDYNIIQRFILMNTIYLQAYKYITQQDKEYVITARGIRLIERFTSGNIEYVFKHIEEKGSNDKEKFRLMLLDSNDEVSKTEPNV